jgi:transcription elongation factor
MTRARRQEPPTQAPKKPTKGFAPGDHVVVLDGLSKGARGIVVARWPDIGGWQMWRIDLPDAPDRAIRADFLERVGADG